MPDGLLQHMTKEGGRAALAAFGVLPSQPSLGSVGVKSPVKAPGLPGPAKPPPTPTPPSVSASPATAIAGLDSGGTKMSSLGVAAAKHAFAVGMGASNSTDSAGAPAGEPADEGRRQRSVIDRAFQRNDDDYATSSMPMPGGVVSP